MLSQEYICQSGEIGVPPAGGILLSLRILVRELFSVGHVSTPKAKTGSTRSFMPNLLYSATLCKITYEISNELFLMSFSISYKMKQEELW